ncbi:MAG: F0F1 ATP synthase subunit B [Alphaproteobacteria bacterium]
MVDFVPIVIAQAEGDAPADGLPVEEGELFEEVVLEEEGHEEADFPPFDSTFFASQLLWLVITFVVLYLLMSRLVLPRIGGILEDRRDRIARDLDQAERLKQQSDDALAGYERALAEARAGAFAIASEARDQAKSEAEAKQSKIEADLDAKLADASSRIGEIKAKALADVSDIATEAAEAVVERLLGKKPTAAELDTAVKAAEASNV